MTYVEFVNKYKIDSTISIYRFKLF